MLNPLNLIIMKKGILFFLFIFFISFGNYAQQQIDYGSNNLAGKYVNISDIKVYYET